MKKLLGLLSICLILGCSTEPIESMTSTWIQDINDEKLQRIRNKYEVFGKKKSDEVILTKAMSFTETLNQLIAKADRLSADEIDKTLEPFVTELPWPTRYQNFKSWDLTNSTVETKTQLALLGSEVLATYELELEMQDIIFERIQILFVPDEISIPEGENLKGKYVIAATSSQVSEGTELFVDGKPVSFFKGEGLIDIPYEQLRNKNKLEAILDVKVDQFKNEIKYKTIHNKH